VGTESAHAFFFRNLVFATSFSHQRALRSIIHTASIDCAGVFARNANVVLHCVAIGVQMT
jgi:hypothetical protein